MMKKRWILAAAVIAVALVGTGVSVAALQGEDHGIHKKKFLNFIAVDVPADEAFIDVEPKATGEGDVSAGDTIFFHQVLWNTARTEQRGDGYVACTAHTAAVFHCRGTAFVRGGTIEFAGAIDFARTPEGESFFLAVTGGTERYENVVGEAKVTEQGESDRVRIELIPSYRRP
jgi:hypothetical protein